ncbi:hypothetical protein HDU67_006605, partial [Dinochytrium kinnereticum]
KPWALKGEVNSKARPVNSLLEETLEVEHASRPAPVVTEETTATLEDLIRQRIKDALFDDVERRLPPREKTYNPNRRDIIDENKSSKSLADIYESDYVVKTTGAPVKTDRDAAVEAAHKEIDELFSTLCSSLDALANYQYAPEAPKIELQVVAAPNVPALAVEEVVPASVSDGTLAAPEEVYGGVVTKSKSEMTSKDRKKNRLRQKKVHKKERIEKERERKAREATGVSVSVGSAKEKAMKELLKQKNVTVVADGKRGKGSTFEAFGTKGKGKLGKTIRANVVERGGKLGSDKKSGKSGDSKSVKTEFLKL